MANDAATQRWRKVLRYTLGGALCLLAAINVLIGSPWYLPLGAAAIGVGIIIGSGRRLLGGGVGRSEEGIVCRYIPWCESNPYIVALLIPLLAVSMVGAASAPSNPAWLRYGGIVLLAISAMMVCVVIWIWQTSILCITPTELTVRIAERGSVLTDIRRERVQSIELKRARVTAGSESVQVEVAYRPTDVLNQTTTARVMLGLYLTVETANLYNALVAWKDGATANQNELLDQIEQILRGA